MQLGSACKLQSKPDVTDNLQVNDFNKDFIDGQNYLVLLNQLKPEEFPRALLQTLDLQEGPKQALQNADRIGCRKYLKLASPVAGNLRLNLAFLTKLVYTS